MGICETFGVGAGVEIGVAGICGEAIFTLIPAFQMSFLPDLTQVYSLPLYIEVCPIFLHVVPALTALTAGAAKLKKRVKIEAFNKRRFTAKCSQK